ncbi:MAG: hypothetical protein SFU56_05030 [Capsulimonadales bacterium]|nr:hypothetical protein [Capsulimonadales bacterium]
MVRSLNLAKSTQDAGCGFARRRGGQRGPRRAFRFPASAEGNQKEREDNYREHSPPVRQFGLIPCTHNPYPFSKIRAFVEAYELTVRAILSKRKAETSQPGSEKTDDRTTARKTDYNCSV